MVMFRGLLNGEWCAVALTTCIFIGLLSCSGGELRRTDTSKWETRASHTSGVKVEVPTGLSDLQFSEDRAADSALALPGWAKGWLAISLHPTAPPVGVLDDTTFLITIRLKRMSKADFELHYESRLDALPSAERYRRWYVARHETIDRYDEGGLTHYRHDLRCVDDEVVFAEVEVRNVYEDGRSLYVAEDDAIVRRILSSVRCLTPQKGPALRTSVKPFTRLPALPLVD